VETGVSALTNMIKSLKISFHYICSFSQYFDLACLPGFMSLSFSTVKNRFFSALSVQHYIITCMARSSILRFMDAKFWLFQ
jgi:hypothetical protein